MMTKKEYAKILHGFEPEKSISYWMKNPKESLEFYYEEIYLPQIKEFMVQDLETAKEMDLN